MPHPALLPILNMCFHGCGLGPKDYEDWAGDNRNSLFDMFMFECLEHCVGCQPLPHCWCIFPASFIYSVCYMYQWCQYCSNRPCMSDDADNLVSGEYADQCRCCGSEPFIEDCQGCCIPPRPHPQAWLLTCGYPWFLEKEDKIKYENKSSDKGQRRVTADPN